MSPRTLAIHDVIADCRANAASAWDIAGIRACVQAIRDEARSCAQSCQTSNRCHGGFREDLRACAVPR